MSLPALVLAMVALVLPVFGAVLEEVETGDVAGFLHAGSVTEIVCHPNGKDVLSSSRDQCARLWDIESGQLIRRFSVPGCGDMWGIRFIRDGEEFLAATSSGKIYRFEVATGKVLMSYEHPETAYRIALMPDGEHFIGTDGKNKVFLWNIASGEKVRSFDGHTRDVYTAIVTEDGKALVTGSDDKTLKQWDVETGKCRKTLKGEKSYGDIYTLAISPDKKRFAMVSGDGYLRVFDSESLDEIWKVKLGKEGEVVAWSPDGSKIASTSEDENLYLLNATNGKILRKIKVAGGHHTPVAFSADGKTLISGGDYHLHLHDVSSGERIVPEKGIPKKNFSYDHIAVSPGGGSVYLADDSRWEIRDRLDPSRDQAFSEKSKVASMTLSADGGLIAIGDIRGNTTIYETSNFEVKVRFKAADSVQAFAFHPDGERVITAGEDKMAILWEMSSGEKLHEFRGHMKEIDTLVLAEDGRYFFTTSSDGSVRVWSLPDRSLKAEYLIGSARPDSVAIFDGGRSLVVAIGEKEIWGKLLAPLKEKGAMEITDVEKLAEGLAVDDFAMRQKAMLELAQYGERVIPVLEDLGATDPETRERILSVPDVLRGLLPLKDLVSVSELEDEFSSLASDPLGVLWAGVLGGQGASSLVIGKVAPESDTLLVLERMDLNHGVKKAVFSPDGNHLGTVNADGSYTLFKVNRSD